MKNAHFHRNGVFLSLNLFIYLIYFVYFSMWRERKRASTQPSRVLMPDPFPVPVSSGLWTRMCLAFMNPKLSHVDQPCSVMFYPWATICSLCCYGTNIWTRPEHFLSHSNSVSEMRVCTEEVQESLKYFIWDWNTSGAIKHRSGMWLQEDLGGKNPGFFKKSFYDVIFDEWWCFLSSGPTPGNSSYHQVCSG